MRRFIPVRTHILLISLVLLGHIKVLLADDNTGQKLARQPIAFKAPTLDSKPLKIGSRRELFVDNYILGSLRGSAKRRLFAMTPATNKTTDVAMTHDADWEGPWCRYAKYIQDNGVIKAWYMGHHTYGWN
ncbi:hypothetical protein OAF91_06470, partial [Akkermansiaceae bacterium]|nr:hypothetical protein [Akkermansiaceae bacterium]